MSTPYIGEIRSVGFNFAPVGWLMCQGQTLNIAEYDVLFTLIGTTYGGDGQTTFNLPDFQSRLVAGAGQGGGLTPYQPGTLLGAEKVTLTTAQMPLHQHGVTPTSVNATTGGTPVNDPTNAYPGTSNSPLYADAAPQGKQTQPLQIKMTPVGSSQAHANVQPVLALNFIIATEGIFPSRP